MFGLVAAAACMPAHDDWLNDLSLMPPMSVTMHALNAAVPHPRPSPRALMTSWAWRTQQRARPQLPTLPRPGKLVSLVNLLFRSACRLLRWDGFPLPRADRWPPPPPGAPMG